MRHRAIMLLRIILTGLFFSFAGVAVANAAPACGGKGQKACPVIKPGPICNPGLGSFNKVCKPCGKANQLACPVAVKGPRCANGTAKQGNYCRPCGGKNQINCPVTQPGKICKPGLTSEKGFCRACGGSGEKPCPIAMRGTVCNKGLGRIDGLCRPCGKLGQSACPAIEVGRQCAEWTTNRNGKCVPCGDLNAGACRITDKGSACKEGLSREVSSGICKADTKELVRRAALEELGTRSGDVTALVTAAVSMNDDDDMKEKLRDEDASALSGNNNAPAPNDRTFNTWTIGAGVDVNAIVGLGGEAGAAMPIGGANNGAKKFKWYANGGVSFQLAAGGSGSLTLGYWKSGYQNLRGPTHGVVFDLKQIATMGIKGADAFKNLADGFKATGTTIAVGVWFDPSTGRVGNFQGITVTVAAGRGADLTGVSYIKGKTTQVCSLEMQCTIGEWEGKVGRRNTTFEVTRQTSDYIDVKVGNSTRRFDRVLVSRKYTSDDGDIIRFRNNFTRIKFKAASGTTGELFLKK